MKDTDVIVIGSGAGGLACALTLARQGKKVMVLEQHYVPGGWSHSFYLDGFRFSPGIHYIGAMGVGQDASRVYEGLGVANHLSFFQQNEKGYDHARIGDKFFHYPAGKTRLIDSLRQQFPHEHKSGKKYVDLLDNARRELHHINEVDTAWEWITMPWYTRHMGKYALFSLERVINWHIKDPLLKAFLNIQCGNHGLSPERASFILHAAMMGHYFEGGFYPAGGAGAIVKAFTKEIKRLGGDVRTSARVDKIITSRKGGVVKVHGVRLANGEEIFADTVVSNADPDKTFLGMIEEDHLDGKIKKKLDNTTYSVPSLNLFLILRGDLRSLGMDSGNIWYGAHEDLSSIYRQTLAQDPLEGDEFLGMFVGSPTLKDPSSQDGIHHTIEAITFVPYSYFKAYEGAESGNRGSEYLKLKEKLAEKMIRTLERLLPGIKQMIVKWELGTPVTNSFYTEGTEGNCYGTEKVMKQLGPMSFHPRSKIEGLYLTGASTLSHGVMGATSSGINTAALILGEKRMKTLIPYDPSQFVKVYSAEHPETWPAWVTEKQERKHVRGKRKEWV
ncbi:MAG: NAD(P)/FAD-dependent oxidoreductase [Saprospiraceae bacterium]|nr:NAD(P)/FAD-dependent oxidoreductase [Saprospiraceae bacterium]